MVLIFNLEKESKGEVKSGTQLGGIDPRVANYLGLRTMYKSDSKGKLVPVLINPDGSLKK